LFADFIHLMFNSNYRSEMRLILLIEISTGVGGMNRKLPSGVSIYLLTENFNLWNDKDFFMQLVEKVFLFHLYQLFHCLVLVVTHTKVKPYSFCHSLQLIPLFCLVSLPSV